MKNKNINYKKAIGYIKQIKTMYFWSSILGCIFTTVGCSNLRTYYNMDDKIASSKNKKELDQDYTDSDQDKLNQSFYISPSKVIYHDPHSVSPKGSRKYFNESRFNSEKISSATGSGLNLTPAKDREKTNQQNDEHIPSIELTCPTPLDPGVDIFNFKES